MMDGGENGYLHSKMRAKLTKMKIKINNNGRRGGGGGGGGWNKDILGGKKIEKLTIGVCVCVCVCGDDYLGLESM